MFRHQPLDDRQGDIHPEDVQALTIRCRMTTQRDDSTLFPARPVLTSHERRGWAMTVVVAWCASGEADAEGVAARLSSLLDDLVPAPWSRDVIGGADWGVTACAPSPAAWRWPAFA